MKDVRESWYDPVKKIAVTIADVTSAAQDLARAHLSGPTAAHYLAKALAAAAVLADETSEPDETLILQMKCDGPLGGFNVECTSAGTLRGYTEKKLLDEFDGMGAPDDRKVLGKCQIQVTRSIPGKILSQGISTSIDGYLAGSLQRRACIYLEALVNDEVEVLGARGVLVEALPDSNEHVTDYAPKKLGVSSRRLLADLGLGSAELKKTVHLSFACRCSSDRAAAMLAALSDAERASMPSQIDITCHMCGRIFTVENRKRQ